MNIDSVQGATAYDKIQEAEHFVAYRKLGRINHYVFMCRYCPTAYLTPSQLIKHQRKSHEKELNAHRS